jgi:predicted phosphoribosyltransferase
MADINLLDWYDQRPIHFNGIGLDYFNWREVADDREIQQLVDKRESNQTQTQE